MFDRLHPEQVNSTVQYSTVQYSAVQYSTVQYSLHPEQVNWITNYADWTQDSSCYSFTSCSCGVPGHQKQHILPHWVAT